MAFGVGKEIQIGGVRWLLEGDANTGYFHSIANGRRKCRIEFLETGYGRIS
jgi:hypothetical protein